MEVSKQQVKPTETKLAAPSRMRLDALVKGRQQSPFRLLLSGEEGIGKSSFAAAAPSPIFFAPEDGTGMLDVVRFPQPETWKDALDAIDTLTNEKHDFRTLVIDTVDWLEPMLWAHICARDKQSSIESYGYGKGFQAAIDEWRVYLSALERMRKTKLINVILLAHTALRTFKNPVGSDYDRWELRMNSKAAGLLKEWSDAVLFAAYEVFSVIDDRKRVRGVDNNGARVVHTQRRAAWDAKNRYSLPETMPLDFGELAKGIEAHESISPEKLIEAIKETAAKLGGEMEKETLASLGRVGQDAVKLAALNNWATAKLQEKAS
jgi:hypothetical protein